MLESVLEGRKFNGTESFCTPYILKKFAFPSVAIAERFKEFCSWTSGRISLSEPGEGLTLNAGDAVEFDTVANAIFFREWSSLGKMEQIGLRIEGHGDIEITIQDISKNGIARTLVKTQILLNEDHKILNLGELTNFVGERLSLAIQAHSQTSLNSIEWISNSPEPVGGTIWPAIDGPFWILQNFILPDTSRADRTALYAKWPDGTPRMTMSQNLPLVRRERVDLITFFNAFSHRKWTKVTGLRDLSLRLTGVGSARVEIKTVYPNGDSQIIFGGVISLVNEPIEIPLGNPGQIGGELIGIEIIALSEDAVLASASWITREPPRREVRIAAVITTFRREIAAETAIKRFSSETIPGLPAGVLQLFVVDNGHSLSKPPPPGVRIISNQNLGGAGGFTRGLIEAQDSGYFSHVLFMDDDASCESESVWRTVALLSRMGDERASISGAMLLADDPCLQFEKGAFLDCKGSNPYPLNALCNNKNLSSKIQLVHNDYFEMANYGGWWFFAFPIAAIEKLPFPFFVRGDDVDFSISNKLPIVTLNGIASWCDSFAYKANPVTDYLANRSIVALAFMHASGRGQLKALFIVFKIAIKLGFRFDYAGMAAVVDGLKDAGKGPVYFGNNPAPLVALSRVKQRINSTKVQFADLVNLRPVHRPTVLVWRIVACVTLGGHLLPNWIMPSQLRHASSPWDAGATSLLRARAVIYGTGQRIQKNNRNRWKFFRELVRILIIFGGIFLRRRAISKAYLRYGDAFRSRGFWDEALGLESKQKINL